MIVGLTLKDNGDHSVVADHSKDDMQ
ncbi:hypothetical protein Tco_1196058, partial [Tanacetum coccineum]